MNIKQHYLKQSFKFFRFLAGTIIWIFSSANQSKAQKNNVQTDSCSRFATKSWFFDPLTTKLLGPVNWKIPDVAGSNCPEVCPGIREKILNYSLNFLGIRYRSSGKSPKVGFDCSGFTGFVFKNFGLRLQSSSPAQAREGRKVPVSQASVGDLAFFGRKGKKGKLLVNHAAIVISKPGEPLEIIHSASNKGIMITKVGESRYWKNSLLFVRNVL